MEETLEILQENLGKALLDTAYMVVISAVIGVVLGTAVALLLYLTETVCSLRIVRSMSSSALLSTLSVRSHF